MIKKQSVLALLVCLVHTDLVSTRYNLLSPHDTLIRPLLSENKLNHITVIAERGIKTIKGFADDGNSVNGFKIFASDQNTLAMLNGFDPASAVGQLRTLLAAGDDGVRGHIDLCGTIKYKAAFAFGGRFSWASEWSICTYLPYYALALESVQVVDKTAATTAEDVRVRQLLTSALSEHLLQLGCLDISPWSRRGFGDWRTDCIWAKGFEQQKPFLKQVQVELRLGLILPTAKRVDEDKLLADSFGLDGSLGVPFGFGIGLQLGSYIHTGFDVELTHTFSNTRQRRIVTDNRQTEPFLLQKGLVNKDFGLSQRFNMYVACNKIYEAFSLLVGYQYYKHGDDELTVKSNIFSNDIANSARSLDQYTMHHIVIHGEYDLKQHAKNKMRATPSFALFARIPFNGKNSLVSGTIGGSITLSF